MSAIDRVLLRREWSCWWVLLLLFVLPSARAFAQSGDTKGATSGITLEVPDNQGGQIIKIIQKKNFLKAHRLELTGFLGGETINPFVRHYVGGLNATYHFTEVFAVELVGGYSPSLAAIASRFTDAAWAESLDEKDLSLYLQEEAGVRPSTTKMGFYTHTGVVFSPLYGKFAFLGERTINFDIYFLSGFGLVHTKDLDKDDLGNPVIYPTTDQWHFASNVGFGFRAAFNKWMALRLEGREYIFIESVTAEDQENLNLIYYFMVQAGLSVFFPTSLQ